MKSALCAILSAVVACSDAETCPNGVCDASVVDANASAQACYGPYPKGWLPRKVKMLRIWDTNFWNTTLHGHVHNAKHEKWVEDKQAGLLTGTDVSPYFGTVLYENPEEKDGAVIDLAIDWELREMSARNLNSDCSVAIIIEAPAVSPELHLLLGENAEEDNGGKKPSALWASGRSAYNYFDRFLVFNPNLLKYGAPFHRHCIGYTFVEEANHKLHQKSRGISMIFSKKVVHDLEKFPAFGIPLRHALWKQFKDAIEYGCGSGTGNAVEHKEECLSDFRWVVSADGAASLSSTDAGSMPAGTALRWKTRRWKTGSRKRSSIA